MCSGYLNVLFQDFKPTCAGVSVSFIGCPSNLNLICLIASPWRDKHTNIAVNQAWETSKSCRAGKAQVYIITLTMTIISVIISTCAFPLPSDKSKCLPVCCEKGLILNKNSQLSFLFQGTDVILPISFFC